MQPLRLIADEARRVDGYRAERHVSLLALAMTELADYAALCEGLETDALADRLGAFARSAAHIVEGERDGLVVRCGGGQLFAVFAEPTSAVLALRSLHLEPLSLRTGIHLGQVAIERVGLHLDVFGRHVHRACCVAAAARVGEILVSAPVADNARSWVEATSGPALRFAARGRVSAGAADDSIEVFAIADAGAEAEAAAGTGSLPAAFIELDLGDGRRVLFDAASDRRIVIGRSKACDVPIPSGVCSRKHAMIVCQGSQWLLCDLYSSNGTYRNDVQVVGQQPLAAGDRIRMGEVVLVVTRLAHAAPGAAPPGTPAAPDRAAGRLCVDLGAGAAHFGGQALPLSAAELVWFAYLCHARRSDPEGWVVAGQDGHESFRAFSRPLWQRAWTASVRTRPLLDLVAGQAIDDEDLRNLRGKTVQKLKRFAASTHGAAMLVPETDGRHRQRLPLPAPSIDIVGS
jgi:class 3 adenylate cyclase